MSSSIQELKDMALAYKLAQEFDYCPSDLKDALDYDSNATQAILDKYSGNRPDEIANMIIRKIQAIKE